MWPDVLYSSYTTVIFPTPPISSFLTEQRHTFLKIHLQCNVLERPRNNLVPDITSFIAATVSTEVSLPASLNSVKIQVVMLKRN